MSNTDRIRLRLIPDRMTWRQDSASVLAKMNRCAARTHRRHDESRPKTAFTRNGRMAVESRKYLGTWISSIPGFIALFCSGSISIQRPCTPCPFLISRIHPRRPRFTAAIEETRAQMGPKSTDREQCEQGPDAGGNPDFLP